MKWEVDTHCHTIASGHAYSTIAENAEAASKKGVKMIAITDHGPAMGEGGINKYYFWNMRVIPRTINGVYVLRGVEANILDTRGTLDLPEEFLQRLDIVLAGLHVGCFPQGLSVEENTQAIVEAIKNPYVDIIVHPGNPEFPINIDRFVEAAHACNVSIEINNSSFISRQGSEKNCSLIAKKAAELGATVSLGSDAHICFDIANFTKAEKLIEDAKVLQENILNTSAEKVIDFLKSKGKEIVL